MDSIELRNALGRFATGVCVITAAPEGFEPFGMTVNSFSSLSLDPPLVLWSIQKNSDCMAAFDAADGYCVNVLSADQQALSNRFAKKDAHGIGDAPHRTGASGLPVLAGCLASFECKMSARHDGGDHIILVGQVEQLSVGDASQPLVFFEGKYRELG